MFSVTDKRYKNNAAELIQQQDICEWALLLETMLIICWWMKPFCLQCLSYTTEGSPWRRFGRQQEKWRESEQFDTSVVSKCLCSNWAVIRLKWLFSESVVLSPSLFLFGIEIVAASWQSWSETLWLSLSSTVSAAAGHWHSSFWLSTRHALCWNMDRKLELHAVRNKHNEFMTGKSALLEAKVLNRTM